MSILDEDEGSFVDSPDDRCADAVYMVAAELNCIEARMLYIKCCQLCAECIGRKYNILNGCSVCGCAIRESFEFGHITVRPIYVCTVCGSLAIGCGGGDIQIIGIPTDAAEARDNVI